MLVFKDKEKDDITKIKESKMNYLCFSSFKDLVDKLFILTRYTSILRGEGESLTFLGVPYTVKKQLPCICPLHLSNIRESLSSTLYCLEMIFNNYKDHFTNQKVLEIEIKAVNDIL